MSQGSTILNILSYLLRTLTSSQQFYIATLISSSILDFTHNNREYILIAWLFFLFLTRNCKLKVETLSALL